MTCVDVETNLRAENRGTVAQRMFILYYYLGTVALSHTLMVEILCAIKASLLDRVTNPPRYYFLGEVAAESSRF